MTTSTSAYYPTERALRSIAMISGDTVDLEQLNAWKAGTQKYEYRYHIVLKPEYPLTDYDDAERAAQLLFRFVQRTYYGNLLDSKGTTPMPYLTVVEEGGEICNNGKPNLHLHILVGDPIHSKLDFSKIKNRWNYASTPFVVLSKCLKFGCGKSRIGRFQFPPHIENGTIYNQDGIIDYLMKQSLKKKLFVAIKGSNLDWSHLYHHDSLIIS